MLVLSRKPLDSILIGDQIKITVIRVDRNQVRLGIEAPPHITVLREELCLEADERAAQKAWRESDAPGPNPAGRPTSDRGQTAV